MIQPGDFSFIKDDETRQMLSFTYQAVNNTNSWEFMKTFEPDPDDGFMFSTHPQLSKISWECEKLDWDGHSGSSWGFSLRHMQDIAKNGWDNYVNNK